MPDSNKTPSSQLYDLTLKDGSSTKVTVFGVKERPNAPVVICCPAMGIDSDYYIPFAHRLVAHGFIAITTDLRGRGHSSLRPSKAVDFGYHEMLDIEYVGIFQWVEAQFPTHTLYLWGHSLGGQLGSLYAAAYPHRFSGIILATACSVYVNSWKGLERLQLNIVLRIFRTVAKLLGYFPGHRLGFGGMNTKTTILDWSHQGFTSRYEPINSTLNFEAALKKYKANVLALSVKGDYLAPPEAVEHLLQKFHPHSTLTHIHVDAADTPYKKLSHFSWVKQSDYFIQQMKKWISHTP